MSAGEPSVEVAAPARLSASVEETERLGQALAAALEVGDVLALCGPLGAGKTRLVAGLARGLDAAARVRSPSFTLVNEYRGRVPLIHLDLYRLDPAEVEGLGIEEYLERGALVVEWGEKLPRAFRQQALTLDFEVVTASQRRIVASACRGRGLVLLEAWRGAAQARCGA